MKTIARCLMMLAICAGLSLPVQKARALQAPVRLQAESQITVQPVGIVSAVIEGTRLTIRAGNASERTITYVKFKLTKERADVSHFSTGANEILAKKHPNRKAPEELFWRPGEVKTFTYEINTRKLDGKEQLSVFAVCFGSSSGWIQGFYVKNYGRQLANGLEWDVDMDETNRWLKRRDKDLTRRASMPSPGQTVECRNSTRLEYIECGFFGECDAFYIRGYGQGSNWPVFVNFTIECYDEVHPEECTFAEVDEYVTTSSCP